MENTSKSGISVVTLLTIVFLVLKLTHVIGWSWWWVLSPLWICAAIILLTIIVLTIFKVAKKSKRK